MIETIRRRKLLKWYHMKKKKAFDKIKSFGEKQEHESFKSIETMCWMHNFTNIQVQCMLNFAYTFSPDPLNSTIYTKVLSFLFEQRKKKFEFYLTIFMDKKKPPSIGCVHSVAKETWFLSIILVNRSNSIYKLTNLNISDSNDIWIGWLKFKLLLKFKIASNKWPTIKKKKRSFVLVDLYLFLALIQISLSNDPQLKHTNAF